MRILALGAKVSLWFGISSLRDSGGPGLLKITWNIRVFWKIPAYSLWIRGLRAILKQKWPFFEWLQARPVPLICSLFIVQSPEASLRFKCGFPRTYVVTGHSKRCWSVGSSVYQTILSPPLFCQLVCGLPGGCGWANLSVHGYYSGQYSPRCEGRLYSCLMHPIRNGMPTLRCSCREL